MSSSRDEASERIQQLLEPLAEKLDLQKGLNEIKGHVTDVQTRVGRIERLVEDLPKETERRVVAAASNAAANAVRQALRTDQTPLGVRRSGEFALRTGETPSGDALPAGGAASNPGIPALTKATPVAPSTEKPATAGVDLDKAVEGANAAIRLWQRLPKVVRGALLTALALTPTVVSISVSIDTRRANSTGSVNAGNKSPPDLAMDLIEQPEESSPASAPPSATDGQADTNKDTKPPLRKPPRKKPIEKRDEPPPRIDPKRHALAPSQPPPFTEWRICNGSPAEPERCKHRNLMQ